MRDDIIKEKQNMTYLSWSKIRNSSGTAGSFLKSYSELGGHKVYYKLSNFDNLLGVVGHECVNEIMIDRLLDILGVEHLHYELIHADIELQEKIYEVYLCASNDFKGYGESKIALEVYYEAEHNVGETPLDFCIRNGWSDYIYQMLVIDYLILNRDRHGANIEVLRNSKTKTIRLAPLFDHGLSLLFSCRDNEAIEKYDITEDKPCNTYIGGHSAWENLKLIPRNSLPKFHALKYEDKGSVMKDLDGIISPKLQDKIWEMIWERWCRYEDFCNQK